MERKFPARIPDLRLLPWRVNKFYDLKYSDGKIIGSYCEYINEQTSKFGVEIRISGSLDKIILWEEAMFLNGKEIDLRYIAHSKKFIWQKIRVKNMYHSRIEIKDSPGCRNIFLYFALVIRGEIEIPFSVKV